MNRMRWMMAVSVWIAATTALADVATVYTSDDAWVNGNTSQQGDNYGEATNIRIRHDNETWGNNYGMATFDLSPITSTLELGQSIHVNWARMRFYTSYISWPGPTNFSPVAIFRNTTDWDESTVVWTNKPSYDSTAVSTLEYFGLPTVNQVYFTGTNAVDTAAWLEYTEVSVGTLVEGWVNGTLDNYGVSIKATEIVDSSRMFSPVTKEHVNPAVRPSLIVNYTIIDDEAYAKFDVSDDAWVNGNTPQQTVNYGDTTAMRIRHDNDTWGNNYSMAQFDLSSITDAMQDGDTIEVNSAQIRFYSDLLVWPGPTNFSPVGIFRNTTAWDETSVTWTTAPVTDSVAVATLDYFGTPEDAVEFTGTNTITSGGWLEYTGSNVASLVEGWINGTADNNGVTIQATEIVDSSRLFTPISKENADTLLHPEIIINYTLIPGTAGPSQIISLEAVSSNVFKILVNTDARYLSAQSVVGRDDLSDSVWTNVPHSDQASGPFVETNFLYSTAEDTNYAVYVESTGSEGFFGIK